MSIKEIVGQHVKSFMSSIKNNQAIYTIGYGDEDNEEEQSNSSKALLKLKDLTQILHEYVIEKKINTATDELRCYTKSKEHPDKEYYSLASHLNIGYSPFMFNQVEDETRGVFVKIKNTRFVWCTKTIGIIASEMYETAFKNDEPVTMKEARAKISDSLLTGNVHNIPLLEKSSYITFYIDLKNQRILAKSSHSDQDGISAFFVLLKRLAEKADEDRIKKVATLADECLKNKFAINPYTNSAMRNGQAYGAYSLSNLVDFYAEREVDTEENKKLEACGLTPTWSANFASKHDSTKVINFKNSISLFIPDIDSESPPPTTFTMINNFAKNKDLNVGKINVVGEIPSGSLLKKYIDFMPEDAEVDEAIKGDFIDVTYSTQSKDGNICMQITDPLSYHKIAVTKMLDEHFKENACSNKEIERTILIWLGEMLGVLHDSIDMFTTLYLESNAADDYFNDDAVVEKAMRLTS